MFLSFLRLLGIILEKEHLEINSTHIIPWLQGGLTSEELQAFKTKMKNSSEFKKEVDDMRFIWQATENLNLQRKVEIAPRWQKLSRQIYFLRYREKAWKYACGIAVAAFIPLLLGIYSLSGRLSVLKNDIPDEMEVVTAYGLVSKIVLPDSSVVSLNSGSTLRYPQRFVGNTRTVSLQGEAYFKVKADKMNRFDVLLPDGLRVSAYGTEFNINAYADQAWIETVLAEGHVEISRIGDMAQFGKRLEPGQMAYAYKGKSIIEVSDVNVYTKTAWREGKIVFRRAKMPEIVRRLSQHFNVDIELQDRELFQYEYSATFTTETLNEILNLLKQSAPIQWHYIEPQKQKDYTYTKRKVVMRLLR